VRRSPCDLEDWGHVADRVAAVIRARDDEEELESPGLAAHVDAIPARRTEPERR
jgi:hypothetical protein